jgi:hypothetical protein
LLLLLLFFPPLSLRPLASESVVALGMARPETVWTSDEKDGRAGILFRCTLVNVNDGVVAVAAFIVVVISRPCGTEAVVNDAADDAALTALTDDRSIRRGSGRFTIDEPVIVATGRTGRVPLLYEYGAGVVCGDNCFVVVVERPNESVMGTARPAAFSVVVTPGWW